MRWWLVLALGLSGCGKDGGESDTSEGDTDTDTDADTDADPCDAPYVPFDDAAGDEMEAMVAAHAQIQGLAYSSSLSGSDFTTMSTLYTSSGLAAAVQGVNDRHSYAAVPMPGSAMHDVIQSELGRGGSGDATQRAISGATVDILLQRYFALALYDELTTPQRETDAALWESAWDRAYAAYGASYDTGEAAHSLSATAGAGDAEFGLGLNEAITGELFHGRCELAAGDSSLLAVRADAADVEVMRSFGAAIAHEMDVYGDDEWVHWWIALRWWNAASDYAYQVDPTKRDAIQFQFDLGSDGLDPAVVKTEVEAVFGL
jgi:hypothetical protein